MTVRLPIALLLFALLPSTVVAGSCSTTTPHCRGTVDICNCQSNTTWSYTIWRLNPGGRENFVLRPGEHHISTVQTGDSMSSIRGSSGVPGNVPRVPLTATY